MANAEEANAKLLYTSVGWQFIYWSVSTAFYAHWYLVFVFSFFFFSFWSVCVKCCNVVCIGQSSWMDGPRTYAHAHSEYAHAYIQIHTARIPTVHTATVSRSMSALSAIPANICTVTPTFASTHTHIDSCVYVVLHPLSDCSVFFRPPIFHCLHTRAPFT